MISLHRIFICLRWTFAIVTISIDTAAGIKNMECAPFPHPYLVHGRITASDSRFTFQCDNGFYLTSDRQVRCWKGKWTSNKAPKCLKSEGVCDDPPAIPRGNILGEERHVGSVVQYMCQPGFVILGEGRRECLPSNHWGGITPACIEESEPLQKVAERLKNKFVVNLGSYSNDSIFSMGRSLDRESTKHGLELVILIDRSSSVDPVDFKIGIGFVKFLLQEFGVRNGDNAFGTRAAVITFGTEADMLFNLDNATITGPVAANTALDSLKADGGGTNMEAALSMVITDITPREDSKRAIFMVTDGEPNIASPGITPEDFAHDLKGRQYDYEIFTVGIGRGINKKLLSSMASEPLFNHVFILDKYSDLRNIMKVIQDNPPKPKPISPERCGYVKDEKHHLKSWSWLAAIYIGYPNQSNGTELRFCTGTVICHQWIITAASCFFNVVKEKETIKEITNNTEHVFLSLGVRDLLKARDQMNFYSEVVNIHPDFDPQKSDLLHNVALVKLNENAPAKRFRPACLPPTNQTLPLHRNWEINASIAGWGLPSRDVSNKGINGGTVQFELKDTPVELALDQECQRYSGTTAGEGVFCAGFGMNTCIGDLGSPIIAVNPANNYHHVIGVLSRKSSCKQGFNQYIELTKYLPWINEVTSQCQHTHHMR